MVEILICALLEISYSFYFLERKYFENWLTFGTVTAKNKVEPFFAGHSINLMKRVIISRPLIGSVVTPSSSLPGLEVFLRN